MKPRWDRPLRCPLCKSSNVSEYDKHRIFYSRCYNCHNEFNVDDEKRDLFHQLWTRAAELDNYAKDIWNRLQVLTGW